MSKIPAQRQMSAHGRDWKGVEVKLKSLWPVGARRLVRFFDSDGFCRMLAAIPIGFGLAGCIVITYEWGLMHKAKIATLRQEIRQQARTPTSDKPSASVREVAAPQPEQPTKPSHEPDDQSQH